MSIISILVRKLKSKSINFQLSSLLLPVIVLIGPPGSGKTVVGQILANELNWQFWDTDMLIETAAGLKITDIFSQQGEAAFRFLEKTLLENILALHTSLTKTNTVAPQYSPSELKGTVISCGGGLPIPPENFASLAKLGNIVYLDAPAHILMSRISHMKHRPLLDTKEDAIPERLSRLQSLLSKRQKIYAQAKYKIDTTDKSIETVVSSLRATLNV